MIYILNKQEIIKAVGEYLGKDLSGFSIYCESHYEGVHLDEGDGTIQFEGEHKDDGKH